MVMVAVRQLGSRHPFTLDFPGSEMLTAQAMTEDILNGGSLSDWLVPEAPYFAPDWLIALILQALQVGPGHEVWLIAASQIGLLWLGWGAIVARTQSASGRPWRIMGGLVPVTALVFSQWPYSLALVGFWRFGTVLNTIACMVVTIWYLQTEDQPETRWMRWMAPSILAGLVAISHLSDESILVWFTAPALLSMLVATYGSRRPKLYPWLAGVAAGHLAAGVLEPLIGKATPGYQAAMSVAAVPARLKEVAIILLTQGTAAPVSSALVAFGIAAGIWHLVREWPFGDTAEDRPLGSTPAQLFVIVHVVMSSVAALSAQLVLGGDLVLGIRYSLIVFFLPVLYVGSYGAGRIWEMAVAAGSQIALKRMTLFGLSVGVLVFTVPTPGTGLAMDRTPPEAVCLNDALSAPHLKRGVASWVSQNTVMVYTSRRVQVVNYRDGGPGGPIWATSKPHNTSWVSGVYDFAVVDEFDNGEPSPWLSIEAVTQVAGPPRRSTDCGRWQVLDYGPGGLNLPPGHENP